MIQKPNIKFTDASTNSMKKPETKFPLFPNRKPILKSGQFVGSKQSYGSPGNEMDHKLSCSGPI